MAQSVKNEAQLVNNPPAIQETACNTVDPGSIPWRRKWQPTPVFLPRKSHGLRSMSGYSPWGRNRVGHSVQFSSVSQSCPTLCDPMNRSTPGLPVHHHHPEFTETHVHRVSDAIQPSHPLSSPSPPTFNLSQHQALFK